MRDFIHENAGLNFEDSQRVTVRSRLAGRLLALDLPSFEDYYHYLRFSPNRAEEFLRLVDHLTNNETYFFREAPQLKVFSDHVLKAIEGAQDQDRGADTADSLGGLLERRGGADPRHARLRQRAVLLGMGRAVRGPRHRPKCRGARHAWGLPPELLPFDEPRPSRDATSAETATGGPCGTL